MRITVSLLLLWAFAVAEEPFARRYDPIDDNPEAKRYVYRLGSKGRGLIVEDLFNSEIEAKASASDVSFYLHTRTFEAEDSVGVNEVDYVDPEFDPTKKTVFIIHGWNNNHLSAVNRIVSPAVLNEVDVNIFNVDWSNIADRNYLTASGAVTSIGEYVGQFMESLTKKYNMDVSLINCVGHSLGAHVCGNAGAYLNGGITSIIGLDPAGPLFSYSNTENRVDPTDAKYVQVIHTCGGFLGFSSSIGHIDFFPNGGMKQTGCGIDLIGTCSHSRAYQLYADSFINGNLVGRKCDSYAKYNDGSCTNEAKALLGGISLNMTISGDFYLNTNAEEPYGMGDS